MTARVCNRSFSDAGSASMREARMPWTVGGMRISVSGLVSLVAPLRTSTPCSTSARTISSMKKGLPWVFSMISRFERLQAPTPAEQRVQHLVGALTPQRIEAQLGVTGAVAPHVMVLGPVVDQHEDARTGDTVDEQVQKLLGLRVDPVPVLEDHHQRLLEALIDDDALDRLQRAPASHLRIHHRQ